MAIHSFIPHAYAFSHMHLSLSFFVPSLFMNIALSTSVLLSQIFLRYPLFILSCACLSPYLSFYIPFPCSHPCHTISLTSPLYNSLLSLSNLVTFVCFSLFSSCFHSIWNPSNSKTNKLQMRIVVVAVAKEAFFAGKVVHGGLLPLTRLEY